ncbi:MAG TPA: hypothetical protein VFI91_10575 [Longimicrobiaceae bacterium]|nr:hypothetical protein [Longimicrobiaceae bacterium]
MADTSESTDNSGRGGDRRGRDRRKTDRRAPVPPWRQPWALVAYGVAGAIVLMLVLGSLGEEEEEPPMAVLDATVPTTIPNAGGTDGSVQNGYTAADFERLTAEGGAAVGQRVRTELYCESISSVSLRTVDSMNSSLAALADVNRRVPAAECKWGRVGAAPRQDILLVVPPELAERFASAPVVTVDFVARRHIIGVVEWIGRSDALALRTAAVLRSISDER